MESDRRQIKQCLSKDINAGCVVTEIHSLLYKIETSREGVPVTTLPSKSLHAEWSGFLFIMSRPTDIIYTNSNYYGASLSMKKSASVM